MTGFSHKSYMLQIIQGSILIVACILIFGFDFTQLNSKIGDTPVTALALFLCFAFILGAIIDFIADILETLLLKIHLLKHPSYYLLKNGKTFGIRLAHHKNIRNGLIRCDKDYSECDNKEDCKYCFDLPGTEQRTGISIITWIFNAIDFVDCIYLNHDREECKTKKVYCENRKSVHEQAQQLFLIAQNIALREGNQSQIEQMDAYFSLHIFSRNLSLSIFCVVLVLLTNYTLKIAEVEYIVPFPVLICSLILTLILLALSFYRYQLYYARSVLGMTL
ncbi:MAG: hypothetical protein K8S24_08610 [Candidatus Aegiribacteria sp.]|nr:hypothetical protein [Candidatus Aegiribacteria sp.]